MPNVHEVAHYILDKMKPITAMKLQKLVYYAQAWSLVWDEAPLFEEEIQAWANGPVAPDLYRKHRGMFMLTGVDGEPPTLSQVQLDTINAVLEFYGPMTSQHLSELTHSEDPWKDARVGLADGERGENVISHASMHEYYSSL